MQRIQRLLDVKKSDDLMAFLRCCCIVRALRREKGFLAGGVGRLILIVPRGELATDYEDEMEAVVAGWRRPRSGRRDPLRGSSHVLEVKKSPAYADSLAELMACSQRMVIVASDESAITTNLRLAADYVRNIEPPTPAHWQAGLRLLKGLNVSATEIAELMSYSAPLAVLSVAQGRSVSESLRRLRTAQDQLGGQPKAKEGLRIEDLAGYGPAAEWALDLARDLADWRSNKLPWSDVDRGVLLSGPPGVGKSTFAKALAGTCEAHLIATSIAQWQSCGHMGDLLKAMREDFKKAQEKAPSILFLDEFDSIGDRSNLQSGNAAYCREVINALLEAIDGVAGREGVVVVGACNDITHIDPAFLRSGRLDRHIVIPLPDERARTAILKFHDVDALDEQGYAEIASLTAGFSGADLEALARRARRRARKNRRAVAREDYLAELPQRAAMPNDLLWSTAVHEAGHAIVATLLGRRTVAEISINRDLYIDAPLQAAGYTIYVDAPLTHKSRSYYLDEITRHLGGLAGEKVILGEHGDGGGGTAGSDLQKATDLATVMEVSVGLGSTIGFSHASTSEELERLRYAAPALTHHIESTLQDCLRRAVALLEFHRAQLLAVANALKEKGRLDRPTLLAILSNRPDNPGQGTVLSEVAPMSILPASGSFTIATSNKVQAQ